MYFSSYSGKQVDEKLGKITQLNEKVSEHTQSITQLNEEISEHTQSITNLQNNDTVTSNVIQNIQNSLQSTLEQLALIKEKIVPEIGELYFSTVETDLSSKFPGTTWELWGGGRVPVGIDTTQEEFNAPEKTGGEKTHALTSAENGPHTHAVKTDIPHSDGPVVSGEYLSGVALAAGTSRRRYNNPCASSGSGTAHNNLQPYITCYIYKRIS